jgi:hypothetical protein
MEEVRVALSLRIGADLKMSDLRLILSPAHRQSLVDVLMESVSTERLEHVVSTMYVTLSTCLAAGLSENAAKFGLGLNVSSAISQSLARVMNPMIPDSQPLLKFFSRAICTSIGIITAFRLEKSLLIWANCLFGAELIISALEHCISPRAILDKDRSDSKFRTTILWTVAAAGLAVQMAPGQFDMPVLVRGILIGPRMVEYGLQALSVYLKNS